MIEVAYKPSFLRQLKKLDSTLQEEVLEKIDLFKDPRNHKALEVHPLHGRMTGKFSFSVDFRNRVAFKYPEKDKTVAVLLAVGDHSIYR